MTERVCKNGMCGPVANVTVLDCIEDGKFLTIRMSLNAELNISVVFLADRPSQFNCCTDAPNVFRSRVLRTAEQHARQYKTRG